jgi:L-threonylcarbamoyladenylate synthase
MSDGAGRIVAADHAGIARGADILRAGGLVAIPTDTFYGLAADPFHAGAMERLRALKLRGEDHPVPLLIGKLSAVDDLAADFPVHAMRIANEWWPGPLTVVLRASEKVPGTITGGTRNVGLRIANHPTTAMLIAAFGGAVTGTSANRAGEPPAVSVTAVELSLGKGGVDLVLDGGLLAGRAPSTVVDCTGEEATVLREGAIPTAHVVNVAAGDYC